MSETSPLSAWGELRRHWPTLMGATLGVAIGASALPFYTGGLFIGHFEQDFGWTRSQLTGIGLIGTLLLAAIAPFAGAVIDRFGVLGPAAVSFLALAAGFFITSRLQGSLLAYAILTLSLTFLAAGSTPIAFTRPVNAAFDKMRGLALGVTIGGIGATAAIAPPIVAQMIEARGWRGAYEWLAVLVLCVAPFVLLLISWGRTRAAPAAPAAARAVDAPAERRTLPLKDPLFWRLIFAFILIALAVAGFVTHFVPMLTDAGLPAVEAAKIAGLLGVAVLVGRVSVGFVIDHVFAPFVAAGLLLVTAAGLAILAAGGAPFALAGALAVGLAMGAEVDLIAYLTARYFGMEGYGRLYGVFYGAFLIGTGTSPYAISLIEEACGSYAPALWAAVGLLVAAAALFATAPKFPAAGQQR